MIANKPSMIATVANKLHKNATVKFLARSCFRRYHCYAGLYHGLYSGSFERWLGLKGGAVICADEQVRCMQMGRAYTSVALVGLLILVVVVTFFNHNFVNCKAALIVAIKIYEIKCNISLNDIHT